MLNEIMKNVWTQLASIQLLIMILSAVLNVLFAGAVAKDAGQLQEEGMSTILVSGLIWAFATLVGGVFVAATYWVLHHSKLTRN
jgi:hypothetical protein